jgi:hypothetical protein
MVDGGDNGRGKIYMVWRGKRRKKILKFSKGVETPKIEGVSVRRVIFRKACEPRVIWREEFELRVKFRNSSSKMGMRRKSSPRALAGAGMGGHSLMARCHP